MESWIFSWFEIVKAISLSSQIFSFYLSTFFIWQASTTSHWTVRSIVRDDSNRRKEISIGHTRPSWSHNRSETWLETHWTICPSFHSTGEQCRDYGWRVVNPAYVQKVSWDYFSFAAGSSLHLFETKFRLVIGFVSRDENKTNSSIVDCDIDLYQFDDPPSKCYNFVFSTGMNNRNCLRHFFNFIVWFCELRWRQI